ncbi:MAG: hypothetical protein PUE51_13345 [Veillonellaceae bacterium]|nr:hypothetical protein [Veillonellaceae bacterium]MDD6699309.1 hypothetical protein [Veillonellaceae bacterium]
MDFCKVVPIRLKGRKPLDEWKREVDEMSLAHSGKCVTRKATKAELKAAEQDAEKDLWRTYHRHLGDEKKVKGQSFSLGFLQQMARKHRVVARDGSVRMSKVKRLWE